MCIGGMTLAGETEALAEKSCRSANLSPVNTIRTDHRSDADLKGERPAIKPQMDVHFIYIKIKIQLVPHREQVSSIRRKNHIMFCVERIFVILYCYIRNT
jgi:hypothetical protein